MEETSENLVDRVVEWLGKEGYRLEYQTCNAFRNAGLHSTMSHYVTGAEGKPREIDVTATLPMRSVGVLPVVRVLCECKFTDQRPWVLLASGLKPDLVADWMSTPQTSSLLEVGSHAMRFEEDLVSCWHFSEKHLLGHNLVQALRTQKQNKDVAYDALRKIADAAWDAVEASERHGEVAYQMAFPCLIVDGPLFYAWVNSESGVFEVKRVSYGRLSWAGSHNGTMVDVVHSSAVAEYAMEVKQSLQTVTSVIHTISIHGDGV